MRAISRLAAVAVLLASGVVHAGEHELSIGPFNRSLRSGSANAVTGDNLTGGTLAVGRSLELSVVPGLELWGTGAFAWGSAEGALFQTTSTEIDMIAFSAGARALYRVHPRLAAGARLDAGAARTALALRSSGDRLSDASWGVVGTAAVTVDVLAFVRASTSIGVRLELGYVTASAPALSPRAERDDSKITLDEMQSSIGHLDLGGRYVQLAFFGQF